MQTPIYKDLSLTLAKHPGSGDILKKTNVDAVKESMRTIIFGKPFDIPFTPNSGGNLRGLLFEMLTPSTLAAAKRNILLSLSEFEPRAVIEDLYIGESSEHGINVGVLFHVQGTVASQTLNFTLKRER